jgi:nitrate/nitrite transporter NarK
MGLGNGPLLMATPMRFVNNSTIIIGFSDAPGGAGGSFRASMIGYTVPSGEA